MKQSPAWFELKLITCLSDPARPLRKVGATARGHNEARNGDFTIGERCTIRIGKHIYPDLPHQHGTFSAVILGPLADGRGYVIRVDEPSCAWHGGSWTQSTAFSGRSRDSSKGMSGNASVYRILEAATAK